MYKIIKKDAVLGIVSNLTWVCMQENGCYGLTVEDNAQGIALNGTVYHVNRTTFVILSSSVRLFRCSPKALTKTLR